MSRRGGHGSHGGGLSGAIGHRGEYDQGFLDRRVGNRVFFWPHDVCATGWGRPRGWGLNRLVGRDTKDIGGGAYGGLPNCTRRRGNRGGTTASNGSLVGGVDRYSRGSSVGERRLPTR